MKKTLTIFIGVLLLCLISVYSVSASTFNINALIINSENITEDTGWVVFDGSQYSPWESGIRSIYVAMQTTMNSTCVGDGVKVYLRPYNDDINIRVQMLTSIHDDPENGDNYIQYVWLPMNESNKIEYKIESLSCTSVNFRLIVVGYDN